MLSKIRKLIVGLGVAALLVAPAVAGQFWIGTSGGQNGGTAVVPSTGGCGQVCFSSNTSSWSLASGPLGLIYMNGFNGNSGTHGEYMVRQGQAPAGTYSCIVDAGNGGYASVSINW